jgi:hypothetical protein
MPSIRLSLESLPDLIEELLAGDGLHLTRAEFQETALGKFGPLSPVSTSIRIAMIAARPG